MRRWLIRLSHSFIILAVVCAWEATRSQGARAVALSVLAAILAVLGLIGLRERHKPE